MTVRSAILGLLVLALGVGCSRSRQPWEVAYPASGSLTLAGKPIAGAQITLVPQDSKFPESIRPTAVTRADGRFDLSTFQDGDGAPRGEYKVSVIWHPLVQSEAGAVRGANALPARYATPDSSGLTVSISDSKTTLPAIDLAAQ